MRSKVEQSGRSWNQTVTQVRPQTMRVGEIERLRREGTDYVVVAWMALWWLGHYTNLNAHLQREGKCILENSRLIGFTLNKEHQR